MKNKLNSYFAVLLITMIGGSAAMFIAHIALTEDFGMTYTSGGKTYAALQKSILKTR
ncbi:MAG: hypothetical protein WC217_00330 [Candidatus Paceibacterota bacterium]|jgi:hypothetical protein